MHIPVFYLAVPALLLLIGIVPVLLKRLFFPSSRSVATIRARSIMTLPEERFFHALSRAAPHCLIFPQVGFGALLDVLGSTGRYAALNRFNQKRADFILCDRANLKVLAIVELDDASHRFEVNRRKDTARDAMLIAAGYRVVRVPLSIAQDEAKLRALLRSCSGNATTSKTVGQVS